MSLTSPVQNYYIVDVFTEHAFDGAQIAVFPDARDLNETQMQQLASELNLSDTVFLQALDNDRNYYQLRNFSPNSERQFAGQSIVGAAFVLAHCALVDTSQPHTKLLFRLNNSETDVVISKSDAGFFIQFSRKAQSIVDRYVPTNSDLATALSLNENDIVSNRHQPMLVSCDQPYLIVPLRSFSAVREATFNRKAWSSTVAPVSPTNEILLFSVKSDLPVSNFHGRLVGPGIGADDDPPIGSAIPAFTGYLSAYESVREGTYSFVIDRGTTARRKSILSVEMIKRDGKENEIRVGGPAVLVASGGIATPPS